MVPESFSLNLVPGTHFISNFCSTYASECPDGSTVSAASFRKTGDNLVADGTEEYIFDFRPRDAYGNNISTGSVTISYTATIDTNQLEQDGTTLAPTAYLPGMPGSAIILSGSALTNMLDGTIVGQDIALVGQDIKYAFKSYAPTSTSHVLKLESIVYTSPLGSSQELVGIDKTPLVFRPWYQASTSSDISEIEVGEMHGFKVTMTNNSSRSDIIPDIFSFFSIGQNAFGAWRDFTSNTSIGCQAYTQDLSLYNGYCEWNMVSGLVTPSVIHTQTLSSFVLTGAYSPMSRYPIKEDVSSENIISYTGYDTFGMPASIIYRSDTSTYGESTYRDSKLKILGFNNAL